MWASVEKWAYPGWTFPVLHAHPDLSMGLDPKFFMSAAGIMEFSLAFALLWTPLVRRIAGDRAAVDVRQCRVRIRQGSMPSGIC